MKSGVPISEKSKLRQLLLMKRREITKKDRASASQLAANLFVTSSFFEKAISIGCYIAREDEFETKPIIDAIWRANKKCYLPVLPKSSQKNAPLKFGLYELNQPLVNNRYQILEPTDWQLNPNELDLVLVPLVGFDTQGHRLGMGGGYYDRTFEFLLNKKAAKPIMVGLAYENQKIELLPTDDWDVNLDACLTEKKIYCW